MKRELSQSRMSHRGVAVAPCDYGNGLVAAESHARGAVALSELPFCFVLVEARASSACDLCLAPHAKMRCARCKAVRYCDAQCQRGAWKNALHKGECGLLAAGGVPAAALDNVRLVCRMAWRLRERDERCDRGEASSGVKSSSALALGLASCAR